MDKTKQQSRYYFSDVKRLKVNNLLSLQFNSFNKLINSDLDKLFKEYFPFISRDKQIQINYHGYEFRGDIVDDYYDFKVNGSTYDRKLYINLSITNNKQDTKEKFRSLYICNLPWMTNKGSFIVNGVEKSVVFQLIRSPGIYFGTKNTTREHSKLISTIIPEKGTWLDFEFDFSSNGLIVLRFNRKSKAMNIAYLLEAFGIDWNKTKELFFYDFEDKNNKFIANLFNKCFSQTGTDGHFEKRGISNLFEAFRGSFLATNVDEAVAQLSSSLFDDKIYDLGEICRQKINKKLDICNQVLNKFVAEDVYDSETKKVVFKSGHYITEKDILFISEHRSVGKVVFVSKYFGTFEIQKINVFESEPIEGFAKPNIITIIGCDVWSDKYSLTPSILIAIVNFFKNVVYHQSKNFHNIPFDDIDSLVNRRIRSVGSLILHEFRTSLITIRHSAINAFDSVMGSKLTLGVIIKTKILVTAIHEFFNVSQFVQLLDQTNPLSELSGKRRITSLGPQGLVKERAGFEIRDVHETHYGRICPIETPEGQNIGLIVYFSLYAQINKFGFIETPYYCVKNGVISHEIKMLDSISEENKIITTMDVKISNNVIDIPVVPARLNGKIILANRKDIDYISVSPHQIISATTSCIPFIERNDANRALMGANMQKQAVPLIVSEAPYVGTGIEDIVAKYSGYTIFAKEAGVVAYVDRSLIKVKNIHGKIDKYKLSIFETSNQNTCISQRPVVKLKQKIKKNDILSNAHATENNEIALGKNILAAFIPWYGYNYEDAIVVSDRLVKDDTFTSLKIEEHKCEFRNTKLGPEKLTADVGGKNISSKRFLDENGMICEGATVSEGDILVGKETPRGQVELAPEDRLLLSLFGAKAKTVSDNSLLVGNGKSGIVQSVKVVEDHKNMKYGSIIKTVKAYIVSKRKIQTGDKMAGRHGNKGVIAKVAPAEDMPFLADGTPVDIVLNPLGIPSRMNIGQIFELQLGSVAHQHKMRFALPAFNKLNASTIKTFLADYKISDGSKCVLYDGKTGEKFQNKISCGYIYMMKLNHMVNDKIHARGSNGPYSLITQQPLGGKSQNGGQRFGEMEVWGIEAYGASNLLRELMTYKSDDVRGRLNAYRSIINDTKDFKTNIPESFMVLIRELQALGIRIEFTK